MLSKSVYVLLVAFVPLILALDEKSEPMVAFLCNRPSMYRTEQGWMKDDNTGCLRDPVDILNYCRKVFPHLDVRNVVEANDKVTIDNWCTFGHKTCRHQFSVRPFRCLVGPFQSDALLVPEHCIFDHVHDSKLCTSYGEWNKTAAQSCGSRSMQLQSFSMLQPCGIDRFNGVEFVCCPNPDAADDSSSEADDVYDDEVEERSTQRAAPPTTTTPVADDALSAYVSRTGGKRSQNNGHKWNEHDYYMKAMEDVRRHHEDKINKMMKEWASARQRVQELKNRDPKAAEKLNKEITARFQKTYDSMELENIMEKKQLSNLHQQRVQAELNEKKQRALDDYMRAIDDSSDPAEILRSLKQYVKVMQKDRLHAVDRYNHLRDTDPAEAESVRPKLAEHLRTVDQQMTMALNLLNRVSKYQKKIQLQISEYLDAYHAIDSRVAVLLRSLEENPPTTPQPAVVNEEEDVDDDESDYSEGDEEAERQERDDEENAEEEDGEENYEDTDDSRDDDAEVVNLNEEQKVSKKDSVEKLPVVKKVGGREDVEVATVTPLVVDVSDDKKVEIEPAITEEDTDEDDDNYDSEDDEDEDEEAPISESEDGEDEEDDDSKDDDEGVDDAESDQPTDDRNDNSKPEDADHDLLRYPEPAHIDKSYISVKEPYISKTSSKSVNSVNAAVPLGIAVGIITILVVIVAGVVVMRRRAHRRLRATVNVRLDQTATPEERHIAAMQMTGYENPTYKYFESSGTAPA